MAHRVNVMLDDEVWEQFQSIPAGERSRLINESLAVELLKRRRLAAIEDMAALRATLPVVPGCSEDWVREDRDSH
jgi:hypothetical protein